MYVLRCIGFHPDFLHERRNFFLWKEATINLEVALKLETRKI